MPELVPPALPAGHLCSFEQPAFTVGELTIRPWRPADAAAVVGAYRDPAIQRWHCRTMSDPEALHWVNSWGAGWAAETSAGWAVTDGRILLGRTGFRSVDLIEGVAEAAYWTVPAARRRGVAVRALCTVSQWMVHAAGFHRLELHHSAANEPSCRVAAAASYQYEGTKRRQGRHQDGWHDMHLHALVVGADGTPDW